MYQKPLNLQPATPLTISTRFMPLGSCIKHTDVKLLMTLHTTVAPKFEIIFCHHPYSYSAKKQCPWMSQ